MAAKLPAQCACGKRAIRKIFGLTPAPFWGCLKHAQEFWDKYKAGGVATVDCDPEGIFDFGDQ
jgi:hypothetical protein